MRSAAQFQLDQLGEIIDSAALNPERWDHFIGELQAQLCGSKIIFQALKKQPFDCLHSIVAGFSEQGMKQYADYYVGVSPWRDLILGLQTSQTVWTDAFISQSELRKTEFYNDMLRFEGECVSATGASIVNEKDRVAVIAVHYDGQISEQMNAYVGPLLTALAPRLKRALDVNRAVSQSRTSFTGDAALLTALQVPAMIVDANGKVLAANWAADQLSQNRAHLMTIGAFDRIAFRNKDQQVVFMGRVRAICCDEKLVDGGDLVFDDAEHPLTISLLPVANPLLTPELRGVAALFSSRNLTLVIMRPLKPSILDEQVAERLMRKFGLTNAEAELGAALGAGESLNEIAQENGISIHTVRTHLRSVFQKTATHRQQDLVALICRLEG